MKADGGHQVVTKAPGTEAQQRNETGQRGWVARVVAVPRVRPAQVRPEGTADTRRVLVVREPILANFLRRRSDTGNLTLLDGHQRVARPSASDQGGRQLLGPGGIAAGLLVDEPPEAPHVLPPLPQ